MDAPYLIIVTGDTVKVNLEGRIVWKRLSVRQQCRMKQEAQLMLTTGSTRLAVSQGQQTWYHSTYYT